MMAPDGMGKTSHQMRGLSLVSLWQSFQVLSFARSSRHWTVESTICDSAVTYLGTIPLRFVVCTVAFGLNSSTIWNGLRWMWNGWEIGGPNVWFSIFHSST